MDVVDPERLERYFRITKEALAMAQASTCRIQGFDDVRATFLDMIQRYISDAEHFAREDHVVDAFAALNYAHGWLDAGARIGLFDVHDSRLFAID